MNAVSDAKPDAEPLSITQADFEKIAVIALEHCGLSLSIAKKTLLHTRV